MKLGVLLNKKDLYFIFFLIIISFSISQDLKIPRGEKKREQYYNKIITESQPEYETGKLPSNDLILKYDSQGFYITTNEDYKAGEILSLIKKDNIISGCDFYPFRDYITALIIQYCNINLNVIRETAIPLFTLIYQMLYLRFGNKDRAYRFYKNKLLFGQRDDFHYWTVREGVKEFMLNMPLEKGNSAFYFSEEELQLAKKLGLPLSLYDSAMGIFDHIYNHVSSIKDEFEKETIIEIVKQKDYFKKYTDYVLRNSLYIKVSEYANMYDSSLQDEYKNYQNFLADKFKIYNEVCFVLMPVFDLLRRQVPTGVKEVEQVRTSLTLKYQVGIGLALDKDFSKGSKLEYVLNEIDKIFTRENLFTDFGIFLENYPDYEKISIPFTFIKNNFSKKKAEFCRLLGCGGFNIDYLMSNNITSIDHNFLIDDKVNQILLNMIKLSEFEDSKLSEFLHLSKFQNFEKLDNQIEIKAFNFYINLIKKIDSKTGEYVRHINIDKIIFH